MTIAQIKEAATDAIMGRAYMQSVKDTLRTEANTALEQLANGDYIIMRPKKNGGFQMLVWRNGVWA